MHGRVFGKRVVSDNGTSVIDDGTSVVEGNEWLADACKQLFPQGKAGTALHYATGFDERSCQRYAAGKVASPAFFLRALLRGDQGWIWLKVIMEGAEVTWWEDLVYAYECAQAFEKKRTEMDRTKSISSSTESASR